MSNSSPAHRWLVAVLRVTLVLALVGAGWLVYRRLPADDAPHSLGAAGQTRDTLLRIIVRTRRAEGVRNSDAGAADNLPATPIQLYSIDVAAAQREFLDERRPGQRFEDFIVRRMGARQPIRTQLDGSGQTVLYVPPGRWWIHATQEGAEDVVWRLPVNVAGREQIVELNAANAYMKTKRF
ncbi:MAG TPA: hypothetical protein VEY11_09325 [Pyrinomonadaceae bacterium]|nr:hypothetical protein [Pyrinomonadaceae bacterium]